MFTDLISATRRYWRQLDEVEAAYNRGDMTRPEVDTAVQRLMTELGTARRQALRDVGPALNTSFSSSATWLLAPPRSAFWPTSGWSPFPSCGVSPHDSLPPPAPQ
jgi:hypothetical protein